ncbi:MAG: DNA recombination protein RmuC [Nitrospinae bacterium]|nr:DNA recombination protein RmuC [Nitrospinota bacterium]
MDEKEKSINELNTKLAEKTGEANYLKEKITFQKEETENLRKQFSVEFENLANKILEEKSKKFTEQNKTNIDQILKPLNEKINEFKKKVEDSHENDIKERATLLTEIKNLADLNQQMSKEANNLTKALKGDSKAQGNWGEVVLENILENSGLVKGREYFVQPSYNNDNGVKVQPDIVIHCPGERSIIIDCKVSLTAYEKYCSADDEEDKKRYLKEHLLSIKKHIDGLSEKNYHDIKELKTLDFVIIFLPVEPAFLLAIQADNNLWNYSYNKKIILISQTNLIAVLKLIESIWKQEYQNKNALEIAKKSGDLYDKFVALVEDLNDVGRKLETTKKSYDLSMNKLTTGKGNLVKRAQELKELGVKSNKSLPQNLVEGSEEELNVE